MVFSRYDAHHALHRMAVEADDLREHRGGEHRRAARLLLQDDLQQDAARQVLAGLGVDDLELLVLEHQLLDVGQRDVGARLGVVEPAVRVLLDQANGRSHVSSFLVGAIARVGPGAVVRPGLRYVLRPILIKLTQRNGRFATSPTGGRLCQNRRLIPPVAFARSPTRQRRRRLDVSPWIPDAPPGARPGRQRLAGQPGPGRHGHRGHLLPEGADPAYKAAFEKANPTIKVEILNKNTVQGIAYVRELPAGQRPDVFWASAPDAFEVLAGQNLLTTSPTWPTRRHRPRSAPTPSTTPRAGTWARRWPATG